MMEDLNENTLVLDVRQDPDIFFLHCLCTLAFKD